MQSTKQQNGRLAEICKSCWKLKSIPIISEIEFDIESSNLVKKRTVNIQAGAITMNSVSTNTMSSGTALTLSVLSPQSSQPSQSMSSPNRSTNDLFVVMPHQRSGEVMLPEPPPQVTNFECNETYAFNVMETFTPED